MSNSIRRARQRPRVDSISFQSLGWLIVRVASYVVVNHPTPALWRRTHPGAWAKYSTAQCRRWAEGAMARWPERRVFP